MKGLGVIGFGFALLGAATVPRPEKLAKESKAKGIFDEDYKGEQFHV